MYARFYTTFIILLVAGLAVAIVQLEIDKSKLRRQLVPLGKDEGNLARLRAESSRNRALLAQFKTSSDAGAKALHAELIAARAELTALETKAAGSPADASATPSIETNRDPAKAMTKLEFLSDVGRASPEAAFQTLIWAALKGRDPELAACLSLDPAARAQAEGLLATLSTEARAKYSTPEQLFGLVVSRNVLEATAVQFSTVPVAGGDHVTLMLRARVNGREGTSNIPMVRSADGWTVAVGEQQIEGIRRALTAETPTH